MSAPTVRINTFVEDNKNPNLDPITKMFIISEAIFGLGRLPLIGKGKLVYVLLTFLIFVALNISTIYSTVKGFDSEQINVMTVTQITQNIICTLLSYVTCKWMRSYYNELKKFDVEAGYRPKVSISSIRNAVQAGFTCVCIVALFIVPKEIGLLKDTPRHYIVMHVIYVLEVHYFGHLLSLLIPRLKLINFHIESSLSSAKSETNTLLKEFVCIRGFDTSTECPMRKLMELYQTVVESYDFLIEGIKWQLLVIITTAFVMVLGFLYELSLDAINSGKILLELAILPVGVTIVLMSPLFAPCMFGDGVHNEVKKLRELLASRLYENKLDKPSRSVARALLALTETRDLSFRLLRMLNVDISLPFKFVGLLVTYLIILLQFEKVINP